MKVIIIGAGLIGTTCLTSIEELGHDVVLTDDIDRVDQSKHFHDAPLDRAIINPVRTTSEWDLVEEEMTHTFFILIGKPNGGKVFGLYGKVSPRRGGVY